MQAKYMTDEHMMFRDLVREFIKRDIAPYHEQWEKDEIVPRDIWPPLPNLLSMRPVN